MSIPNPLIARLDGKRDVQIDDEPTQQIGTDLDHLNLYPELDPDDKVEAPENLTDTNTIFISHSTGSDGNPGTAAQPKHSINGALAAAAANADIIYFCLAGANYVYVEDEYIPVKYTVYNDTGVDSQIRLIERTIPALTDSNCVFVDFKNGDDSTGTGTQVNPYKTLQKGCDIAYAAGGIERYIGILVDNTYTEADYTTEESVELVIPQAVYPSNSIRHILPVWRDAADNFKAGVVAKVKYKFEEKSTSSASRQWFAFFYERGKFAQGGKETIYASYYDAAGGRIECSTDGIIWAPVASAFPAATTSLTHFAMMNISGTDWMFVTTNNGVYKSSNGLAWAATNQNTGDFQAGCLVFNGNIIVGGNSGVYRTPDDAAAWTLVGSGGCNSDMVIWNNELLYANANNLYFRDTNWALSATLIISEVMTICSIQVLGNFAYVLGIDTSVSPNVIYFIKIISHTTYEIITSYETTNSTGWVYLHMMRTIEDRIYISNFYDSDALYAYDGATFAEIGSFPDSSYRRCMFFEFLNRLYYVYTQTSNTIKYALLDCLTTRVESYAGIYGAIRVEGVIFDGDNKKASAGIRNNRIGSISIPLTRFRFNKFVDNYYAGIWSISMFSSYLGVYYGVNSIFADSQYGWYFEYVEQYRDLDWYSLFYNLKNTAFYIKYEATPSVTNYKIRYATLDNVPRGFYMPGSSHKKQIINFIFSRCPILGRSESKVITLKDCLLMPPFYTEDNIVIEDSCLLGTPIFRNRDAVGQDFPDYRLQRKWSKTGAGGEYYLFDSPGADIDGLGAYQFDREIYAYDFWELDWECEFDPDKISYGQSFGNVNQLITVNGMKRFSHEGEQNRLVLSWIPETADEMLTIRTLYAILRRSEKARLTLNPWSHHSPTDLLAHAASNDLGIFSGPSVIGSGTWKAKFDPTLMTLKQNEHDWVLDEFRGWLVYISYDDSGDRIDFWLKITRNTARTLYLKDVDNLYSLPSAEIDNTASDKMLYIIGAMYVRSNLKQLESSMSIWYRKVNPAIGTVDIEFVEA